MPINNVEKSQCLINKKKRFRVRNLFYYEELSQVFPSCTFAHVEVASKTKLEHKESKTPNIKKQNTKC
jgi:hypothetical protein